MYIYINQGWRPCTKLATARGKVLIEYEMPNGTTCLRELPEEQYIKANGSIYWENYRHGRTISYGSVPKYWVRAMVEAGTEKSLLFNPQQVYPTKWKQYLDRYYDLIDKIIEEQYWQMTSTTEQ